MMTDPALAKRGAPKIAKPVISDGVEYRAVHDRYKEKGRPRGIRAFVEARDTKTKKSLWRVQVYDIRYRGVLETDVQDVYIKDLKLDKSDLIVTTDERSRRYFINPKAPAPLLYAPPIECKPKGQQLSQWFDSVKRRAKRYQATAKDNNGLLFRTRFSEYDRLRIEGIERQGNSFTVTMKHEMYCGSLYKNGTRDRIFAVDLGKLPVGKYTAKWVIKTTFFGPLAKNPTVKDKAFTPLLGGRLGKMVIHELPTWFEWPTSFTVVAAPKEARGGKPVKEPKVTLSSG
jgi:hypothetical protein